ncbi:S8 family peptidase [Texcoconibacillus texcoconensis]|uniref:SLH domain-containing protein n=1 Tax=Texcoconibacillus texcoconensis TaxID=1095777 RepID=A0A840QML2_9BACI|nr:S8 family serine peptidase [Texcoconibacillus texcoconensis]MBB5172583.1 hypothetical protein [Texcoconibacillus texcoconensis]
MRLLIIFLFIVLTCCNTFDAQDAENDRFGPKYQSLETEILKEGTNHKRIMILAKNGESPEAIATDYGGTVEQPFEELNGVTSYIPTDQLLDLGHDERVEEIEYDKIVELKPELEADWPTNMIQAPRAWSQGLTGKGKKIGVLDSGIANHEDLNIKGGVAFTNYTDSYEDDNGHGTHVAGIIAALDNDIGITGVAPDSELYAVKVLNEENLGFMSHIITGIDWSIRHDMDIINLSLGSADHSSMLQQMTDKANDEGIVVVSAAGNSGTRSGTENTVNYPARYQSSIAVGAVDHRRNRATFSSTGPAVELSAPGVAINSTYLNNQYISMDGTSFAAPYVTGVAALLMEEEPNASNRQIRERLQNDSIDLGNEGRDTWYGFGLVQAPEPEPKLGTVTMPFTDIHGHWAEEEVISVYERGWMIGSDGLFRPENNLTRAEAATVFSRILQLEDTGETPPTFTDVADSFWASEKIELVAQHGIMIGSGHSFSPNAPLTREQMATMLYRVLSVDHSEETAPFHDVPADRWSYDAITALRELDIVRGISPTTFDPTGAITRAQMSVMLERAAPHFE